MLGMTTTTGIFEHARFARPRREHGYCLDDVARALVVTNRQPEATATLRGALRSYLAFTEAAQAEDGSFRNRRAADGRWTDAPSVADHWGRALWAAGSTAATDSGHIGARALVVAELALMRRSPHLRSMAYAVLGAGEVLRVRPGHRAAEQMLTDAREVLLPSAPHRPWPWPEPRLAYANAVIPEALLTIADHQGDRALHDQALDQLEWLVALQTRSGHISVIPAGGWAPGEPLPGFDQQPIEVAALAEACWRAYEVTGADAWLDEVHRCADWFRGDNDAGTRLYNHSTGGCADGLHADGINRNQGAESTLAALSTMQLARRAVLAVAA
jgi:hypothetical protein